ncbi:MAG: hypothetical protein IJN48_00830, partial [Clostridia bacterium]|nr:hypothetical protein [Clostridia bacterium]
QSCLELFSIWQLENDSKFSTFFVLCAFEVALKAFYDGNFRRCKELLDKIESLLPTLIIKSTVTHNRISFLKSVIDNIDNIDNAIDLANSIPDFEFSPSLFFSLLKLLKSGNHETCQTLLYYCSIETNYRDFLSAQMAIKDYRFIDAILSMKSLYTKNDCPIFLKLLCLVSIENCCKLCDDYKGAYENHLAYEALLATIEK